MEGPVEEDYNSKSLHPLKIPMGTKLNCKSWATEAAYRMLHHNLHPDVAEIPEQLVVYGGTGKCARDWESWKAIRDQLLVLNDDQTLLVQSGKPVGVIPSHSDAPRVLIANSNLVGNWATKDHFDELEAEGLMMYGQMTAGSWIYIGTQGILQGTYETLAAAAKQHFNATNLSGKIFLTAGCGGMGGAQPLACTMLGGVCLIVDVDSARLDFRLRTKYLDVKTESIDEALELCMKAKSESKALSVGLLGNAAEVFPQLLKMNFKPDLVTDQTSAHDPLDGYIPLNKGNLTKSERHLIRDDYIHQSQKSMAMHVEAMCGFQDAGSIVFDYGNNIREQAVLGGLNRQRSYQFPGFVPAYIRPLFCEGKGPFRWVALSGDPEDIYKSDKLVKDLFPEDRALENWIDMAQSKVSFQGLPSRICWLGLGERAKFGLALNQLVADGTISAPIVIGRDHLDCGSVSSPYRETEKMLDGTDAVADWPLLNGMANICGGATWVSMHHGGGVGIGYSQHSGMVIVADGTPEAAKRIERVLTTDPLTGVYRHLDAGYKEADVVAKSKGVSTPLPFKQRN